MGRSVTPSGARASRIAFMTVGVEASQIPAKTAEAEALSGDLKKRGFKFVGPTICYAFMQAAGLVNDHLTSCFRFDELAAGG